MEVGEEGRIYTYRYTCHHQISLIVRDKVTRQCPQTTTQFEAQKGEPKQIRTTEVPLLTSLNDLPLGQTGSLWEFGARTAYN